MTLAEVLVALSILMVTFLALTGSSIAALGSLQKDKGLTRANAYAAQVMERFRAAPWTALVDMSIDSNTAKPKKTLKPLPATVTEGPPVQVSVGSAVLSWVDDASNGCQGPTTMELGRDYLQLHLEVRWTDQSGKARLTVLRSYRAPSRSEQQPALGTPSATACGAAT